MRGLDSLVLLGDVLVERNAFLDDFVDEIIAHVYQKLWSVVFLPPSPFCRSGRRAAADSLSVRLYNPSDFL
jgi:hypothetical protein